ncbi:hypothetical protein ACHHYP_01010 [Achlya hypogyna]|uniref:CNNM transmembrane domain-containing protein n=1 Tax=Achlya hypogyna TaxID=1202772 RepID=A0A1V9Z9H4_ACHHY|nr:hypothetical protein ACHHYP_01010 [Achlya hypogyna]
MACSDNEYLTPSCNPEEFYLALGTVIALICLAGMMAGLTMGLLSLDKLNLQILELQGTEDEKTRAANLLPIIKQHHRLLVTLLLFNAAANEALPIFLNRLVPESQAIIISVTCVLFFGEIIPSALFTGKQQLAIASMLVPLVRLLMFVAFPLAYPIATALDVILGEDHDGTRYKRRELKALVALQNNSPPFKPSTSQSKLQSYRDMARANYGSTTSPTTGLPTLHSASSSDSSDESLEPLALPAATPLTPLYSVTGTNLHNDEVAIIHGALDMSTKTVQMVMTPFDQVYMLNVDTILDFDVMTDILASGYSRIPVFKNHRTNIVGILLVKRLIVLSPEDHRPLKDLMLRRPILVTPDHSCYSILNVFQEGRCHIAVVTEQKELVQQCWASGTDIDPDLVTISGVVTIEDILEEIIMEEIADESDVSVNQLGPNPEEHTMQLRQRGVLRAIAKFKELGSRAKARRTLPRNADGEADPSALLVCVDLTTNEDGGPYCGREFLTPSCNPSAFWLGAGIVAALICTAGLMAGLTMGLLSMDILNLQILQLEGSPVEKARAERVLPLIQRHHLLLVTLLLFNAAANEALPIFLSRLMPEATAVVVSVTCVLLFGEILPSAVFTGKQQLPIAAALVPFVQLLVLVAAPVAYPLSRGLDWLLGEDHAGTRYKRKELKALVTLQRQTHPLPPQGSMAHLSPRRPSVRVSQHVFVDAASPHSTHGTHLHMDEVTIIHGALDLTTKTVLDVMIPWADVFMLDEETLLDANTLAQILASGHSRIPVHRGHRMNIVGLLLVKRLIVLDPTDARPIKDLILKKPMVISPDFSCYELLNEFQKGRSHMALVTADVDHVQYCWIANQDLGTDVEFVGVVTIEDVMEELIQEEIEDEADLGKALSHSSRRLVETREVGVTRCVSKLKLLAGRARRRVYQRNHDYVRRSSHQSSNCSPTGYQSPGKAAVVIGIPSESTPLLAKVDATSTPRRLEP